MSEQPKTKRQAIDWEAMEADWRAGFKSVLQLSKEYGVSRAAILKHWDKAGVERDLSAKITAKTEALVTQALVTQQVTQQRKIQEKEIVEANANVCAAVVLAQRSDLADSAELERKLMAELLAMTEKADQFRELGEMMASPDEFGQDRINDTYFGAISNPQRIKSAKLLMDMRKARIETERKVLRLDEQKPAEVNPLAELVRAVSGTALPVVADPSPEDDDE